MIVSMISHNAHYYHVLCRPCIILCLWRCDKSDVFRMSKQQTLEYAYEEDINLPTAMEPVPSNSAPTTPQISPRTSREASASHSDFAGASDLVICS